MTAGTRLIDKIKIVNGTEPKNYTGAASTSDYVSLKNYNHATVLIQTGAWAGGTSAVTLTQATEVAGSTTKALGFDTVFIIPGDGSADLPVKTAVVANTFDVDNLYDCFRVEGASPSTNADVYGVTILLSGARAGGNYALLPSAIID